VTGRILPLYPLVVIVPVYHKIRLTFLDVMRWIVRLDEVLQLVYPVGADYEWDVHLSLSNHYKKSLRDDATVEGTLKEKLLLTQHPRFTWRAALRIGESEVLELLVDATDFSRSFPFYLALWRRADFAAKVKRILEASELRVRLTRYLPDRFRSFLLDTIKGQFGE